MKNKRDKKQDRGGIRERVQKGKWRTGLKGVTKRKEGCRVSEREKERRASRSRRKQSRTRKRGVRTRRVNK